jgi:hypothetical protein
MDSTKPKSHAVTPVPWGWSGSSRFPLPATRVEGQLFAVLMVRSSSGRR